MGGPSLSRPSISFCISLSMNDATLEILVNATAYDTLLLRFSETVITAKNHKRKTPDGDNEMPLPKRRKTHFFGGVKVVEAEKRYSDTIVTKKTKMRKTPDDPFLLPAPKWRKTHFYGGVRIGEASNPGHSAPLELEDRFHGHKEHAGHACDKGVTCKHPSHAHAGLVGARRRIAERAAKAGKPRVKPNAQPKYRKCYGCAADCPFGEDKHGHIHSGCGPGKEDDSLAEMLEEHYHPTPGEDLRDSEAIPEPKELVELELDVADGEERTEIIPTVERLYPSSPSRGPLTVAPNSFAIAAIACAEKRSWGVLRDLHRTQEIPDLPTIPPPPLPLSREVAIASDPVVRAPPTRRFANIFLVGGDVRSDSFLSRCFDNIKRGIGFFLKAETDVVMNDDAEYTEAEEVLDIKNVTRDRFRLPFTNKRTSGYKVSQAEMDAVTLSLHYKRFIHVEIYEQLYNDLCLNVKLAQRKVLDSNGAYLPSFGDAVVYHACHDVNYPSYIVDQKVYRHTLAHYEQQRLHFAMCWQSTKLVGTAETVFRPRGGR